MSIPYVIRKNGMYRAHNSHGYVFRIELAELYDKEYALEQAALVQDVYATPITELLRDAEQVQDYIDRLEAMRDALLEANQE